jgi:hypothetical protein
LERYEGFFDYGGMPCSQVEQRSGRFFTEDIERKIKKQGQTTSLRPQIDPLRKLTIHGAFDPGVIYAHAKPYAWQYCFGTDFSAVLSNLNVPRSKAFIHDCS